MDYVTFFFALASPIIAILLSAFASVSDAYIERESHESSRDYARAGLDSEMRESIRDIIFRTAKGSLLISNCIATAFNAAVGLFGAIYFLHSSYFFIFWLITLLIVFMLYILKTMVRFGIKDLYVQRVRRIFPRSPSSSTFSFSYGTMIDRAMVLVNFFLLIVVVFVYLYSGKP